MPDKTNPSPVRVIVSVIALGKNTEIINRSYMLPEEYRDPATFAATCPAEYIAHHGRFYRYLDCIAERCLSGAELTTIFHVRYILDLEREKFKTFLRSARPAHCPVKKPA